MILCNAVQASHYFMESCLKPGEKVIDTTAGNGRDTVFLAGLVGETGTVFAFDIQHKALEATRERLSITGFTDNIRLIHDGHENLDKYISYPVGGAMFNLGYLPGGEHSIVTRPVTTMAAVKKILNILKKNGLITIIVYTGHDGGQEEHEVLTSELTLLSQKQYHVACYRFINQAGHPPELLVVEKL